jgi:hypothetical protein
LFSAARRLLWRLLQHSLRAQARSKRWQRRFVPAQLERAADVTASSFALAPQIFGERYRVYRGSSRP